MKVSIYHRRRFYSETSHIAELEGRLAIVDNAVSTLTGRKGLQDLPDGTEVDLKVIHKT